MSVGAVLGSAGFFVWLLRAKNPALRPLWRFKQWWIGFFGVATLSSLFVCQSFRS